MRTKSVATKVTLELGKLEEKQRRCDDDNRLALTQRLKLSRTQYVAILPETFPNIQILSFRKLSPCVRFVDSRTNHLQIQESCNKIELKAHVLVVNQGEGIFINVDKLKS